MYLFSFRKSHFFRCTSTPPNYISFVILSLHFCFVFQYYSFSLVFFFFYFIPKKYSSETILCVSTSVLTYYSIMYIRKYTHFNTKCKKTFSLFLFLLFTLEIPTSSVGKIRKSFD